jgi:hypothetical protein
MSTKNKLHPMIAALVSELETGDAWPLERRITWLKMAAMAFDLVHGQVAPIAVTGAQQPPVLSVVAGDPPPMTLGNMRAAIARVSAASASPANALTDRPPLLDRPLQGDQTHFIDLAGRVFAREQNDFGVPIGQGVPINQDELPADATLWDMRSGEAPLNALEWANGTRGAPLAPVQVLTG